MGLFGSAGLKSAASSISQIIASLVGQDIVARSISLTRATGLVAIQMVNGAQLKLGTGTLDFFTSDGATGVVSGGIIQAGTQVRVGSQLMNLNNDVWLTHNSLGLGDTDLQGNATNGATAVGVVVTQKTDLTTAGAQAFAVFKDAYTTKVFAIDQAGKITAVPNTDSSGTPGNATANTPTGKAAIALGASSCVISNTLVTANSRIFISPRIRDATGLLPIVSAQVASTSFTVSVTVNCTAALPFDWWLIN